MTFLSVGLSVLLVVVAVSGHRSLPDTSCDFTGIDVEAAKSRFLAKMPKETKTIQPGFRKVFPGFEVGGIEVRGWQHLRQFGPATPYCLNGSRLLQMDLVNDGRLSLSVPWRTCSGKEGSFTLSAAVCRFTVQLEFENSYSSNEEVILHLSDYAPSATEELLLGVVGAGPVVNGVAAVLGKLFGEVFREAWNDTFVQAFLAALKDQPTR